MEIDLGVASAIAGVRMGPGIVGNHEFTPRRFWYLHFAYNLQQTANGVGSDILRMDDTLVYPSEMSQCRFGIKSNGPNGESFVLRKLDGTILAESQNYKQEGIYYLQLYIKIGAGDGESRLLVSNVEQWNVTGLDTQETANNTANAVLWCTTNAGRRTMVANIVIGDDRPDGQTPPFTDLMGDFVVVKIQPNAPGDTTELNPVGAAANWDACNDYMPPDEDATYNETNAPTAKDVMHYENIGFITSELIFGANLRTRERKTEAGPRLVTHILKPTTVEYRRYTHNVLDTYEYFSDCYDLNPDTGMRYTKAEIDNHQFGYETEITP